MFYSKWESEENIMEELVKLDNKVSRLISFNHLFNFLIFLSFSIFSKFSHLFFKIIIF